MIFRYLDENREALQFLVHGELFEYSGKQLREG
jgi:hypothetical protein